MEIHSSSALERSGCVHTLPEALEFHSLHSNALVLADPLPKGISAGVCEGRGTLPYPTLGPNAKALAASRVALQLRRNCEFIASSRSLSRNSIQQLK